MNEVKISQLFLEFHFSFPFELNPQESAMIYIYLRIHLCVCIYIFFLNSSDMVLNRAILSQEVVNFKKEWNWNWSQVIKLTSKYLGIWRLTWYNGREIDAAKKWGWVDWDLGSVLALPITSCVAWASPLWKLLFQL